MFKWSLCKNKYINSELLSSYPLILGDKFSCFKDFDIKFGVWSAARRTDLATDYVLCPNILCMSFGQKLIEFIRKKKTRDFD